MQNLVTVLSVDRNGIIFNDCSHLYSEHSQDCCESHELSFEHLTLEDFKDLKFDLRGDFFERVDGYGIRLKPVNGFPVAIPGYGSNNGYYGTNIDLVVNFGEEVKRFDVSECQVISSG